MSDKESQLADKVSVAPVVPTGAASNLSVWIFAIVLLIGGFTLFTSLRKSAEVPEGSALVAEGLPASSSRIFAPPPLVLPTSTQQRVSPESVQQAQPLTAFERARAAIPVHQPALASIQPSVPSYRVSEQRPFEVAPPLQSEPVRPSVVFEQRQGTSSSTSSDLQDNSDDRARASRLANPSTTVPMGTVIAAVLETAFDSTRPGAVRALVQRDIHSFDGSRILIPRGSRLYGTYEAGIVPGEKRALINWTRLLRPDGVIINLDSPASDPLGRAGVEGDVDSRFFARFGGAILQSLLDIGVGVATRQASDGVIVALPGSTQNVAQASQSQQQPRPVLKIDHGTSVSVFVARDLDFSTVEL